MSSQYRLLCLSHTPALEHDLDTTDPDVAAARAALEHEQCDVVLGAYSYPLVRLGCLGSGGRPNGRCRTHHLAVAWTDVRHVRGLALAHAFTPGGLRTPELIGGITVPCWPQVRLTALAGVLGLAGIVP